MKTLQVIVLIRGVVAKYPLRANTAALNVKNNLTVIRVIADTLAVSLNKKYLAIKNQIPTEVRDALQSLCYIIE